MECWGTVSKNVSSSFNPSNYATEFLRTKLSIIKEAGIYKQFIMKSEVHSICNCKILSFPGSCAARQCENSVKLRILLFPQTIANWNYQSRDCRFNNFMCALRQTLNDETAIASQSISPEYRIQRNSVRVVTYGKRMADCVLYMQHTNICSPRIWHAWRRNDRCAAEIWKSVKIYESAN